MNHGELNEGKGVEARLVKRQFVGIQSRDEATSSFNCLLLVLALIRLASGYFCIRYQHAVELDPHENCT